MDINAVTAEFLAYYYERLKENKRREELKPLYRDNSILIFEGKIFVGVEAINKKFMNLEFENPVITISTQDGLPSSAEGNITVLVTGFIQAGPNENPIHFSHAFHLAHDGGFYIVNDIFRLNCG